MYRIEERGSCCQSGWVADAAIELFETPSFGKEHYTTSRVGLFWVFARIGITAAHQIQYFHQVILNEIDSIRIVEPLNANQHMRSSVGWFHSSSQKQGLNISAEFSRNFDSFFDNYSAVAILSFAGGDQLHLAAKIRRGVCLLSSRRALACWCDGATAQTCITQGHVTTTQPLGTSSRTCSYRSRSTAVFQNLYSLFSTKFSTRVLCTRVYTAVTIRYGGVWLLRRIEI